MIESKNIPTPEQVKLIFKETYNLYMKYKNCSKAEEYQSLLNETRELYIMYPFDLCKNIICDLLEVISKSIDEQE